jgi:hypothetical protein
VRKIKCCCKNIVTVSLPVATPCPACVHGTITASHPMHRMNEVDTLQVVRCSNPNCLVNTENTEAGFYRPDSKVMVVNIQITYHPWYNKAMGWHLCLV